MSEKETIDTMLEQSTPRMRSLERDQVWQRVRQDIESPALIRSPYQRFISMRSLTAATLVVLFLFTTSTTVAASQAAKPGDLLFPLERAIERTHLLLASDDRAEALRTEFVAERLSELEEIVSEETYPGSASDQPARSMSEMGEIRVSRAVNELIDHLEEIDDQAQRAQYLNAMVGYLAGLTVLDRTIVESDNDLFMSSSSLSEQVRISDDRIEIKDEEYRIRFRDDAVWVSDEKNRERDDEALDNSHDEASEDDFDSESLYRDTRSVDKSDNSDDESEPADDDERGKTDEVSPEKDDTSENKEEDREEEDRDDHHETETESDDNDEHEDAQSDRDDHDAS